MRPTPETQEDANYALRSSRALVLQREYIKQEFMPQCVALGMQTSHIDALMTTFLLGLGDMYRRTTMSDEEFLGALRRICGEVVRHADAHKYYLSEQGADAGWDAAIRTICAVDIPPVLHIDMQEGCVYHDVFFPVVRTTQGLAMEKEGRRIRSVIRLQGMQQPEQRVETVDLDQTHERVAALLQHTGSVA